MTQDFDVYCDESGHLEYDQQKVMILGAIWCPLEKITIQRQIGATDRKGYQLGY